MGYNVTVTLGEKQELFSQLIAQLITAIIEKGYTVRFGEFWRSPQEAALNASSGAGIAHSLHTEKLAADLNILLNGRLLQSVAELEWLGSLWESYSTEGVNCCWGGRFLKPDTDHFSIADSGFK